MAGVQVCLGAIAVGLILVVILSFRHARRIEGLQRRIEALEKRQS